MQAPADMNGWRPRTSGDASGDEGSSSGEDMLMAARPEEMSDNEIAAEPGIVECQEIVIEMTEGIHDKVDRAVRMSGISTDGVE